MFHTRDLNAKFFKIFFYIKVIIDTIRKFLCNFMTNISVKYSFTEIVEMSGSSEISNRFNQY